MESESGLESARLMDMLRQRLLTLRPLPFIGAPVLIMVLVGLGRVTTDRVTTVAAAIGAGNLLRRPFALEGILQQCPDAFARDGARIVIGTLDRDVRGFIEVCGL